MSVTSTHKDNKTRGNVDLMCGRCARWLYGGCRSERTACETVMLHARGYEPLSMRYSVH